MRRIALVLTSMALVVVAAVGAGSAFAPARLADAAGTVNADKVDGLHAVPARASRSSRAAKLVATNSSGYLPNDIIRKASDADRLDGMDSKAFVQAADLELEVRTVQRRVQHSSGEPVETVSCPSGWTRTGGGFGDGGYNPDRSHVMSSKPTDNGWTVQYAVTDTVTVEVFAICVRLGS